jgi:uncharacterized OB-fold protein
MNQPERAKTLPPDTDLSRPFWEGCRDNELRLQHCNDCDRFQFYPRIVCSHCDGDALSWRAVSGRGHVASFTIVRRGISRAYEAPYVVALIDLDEGPRMMSNVVGCAPESISVGDSVDVQFEAWSSNHTLPVFRKRQ